MLEALAVRQDERTKATQTVVLLVEGEEAQAAGGVVGDEDDVPEIQRHDGIEDQPRERPGGTVGITHKRPAVGAEGQVDHQAPEAVMEPRDNLLPKVAVGDGSGDKKDRPACPNVLVSERPEPRGQHGAVADCGSRIALRRGKRHWRMI
jgi:hypothetical protein